MKLNLRSARIRLEKVLDGEDDSLCRLALDIHRHPELSFQEHRTSELLSGYLSRSGFQVQKNLAGLETSFIARSIKGRSRPALGFLAEMDGLAQLGHACGHNLIGVSSMGAGIILRKAFPQLKGSVEVIGCPIGFKSFVSCARRTTLDTLKDPGVTVRSERGIP